MQRQLSRGPIKLKRNILKGKIVEVQKDQTTVHVRIDVGDAMIAID